MRNIALVFNFELKSILNKKSYIVTTIIFVLLAFASVLIPSYIFQDEIGQVFDHENYSPESADVADLGASDNIEDIKKMFTNAGYYLDTEINPEITNSAISKFPLLDSFKQEYDQYQALAEAVKYGELDFGFVFYSDNDFKMIFVDEQDDTAYAMLESSLNKYNESQIMTNYDLSMDDLAKIKNSAVFGQAMNLKARNSGNIILGFIYVFIIYMMMTLYGSTVSTSIAREKDNRTMEVLIANTKPDSLIIGKSLAAGFAGILQMFILIVSFISAVSVTKIDLKEMTSLLEIDIDGNTIAIMFVYAVFGYIFYLFIYAALGALVSKIEDVNYAITPVSLLLLAGYMITFSGISFPNGSLYRIASMVPFTSVLTMPMRSLLVVVPSWEILLSVAILIISTILFIYLAIRIYRLGSLNYGNRMKFVPTLKLILKGEGK